MGRRRRANPFSLFAFQDIITSVMGIMLLSALILAVELVTQKPTSASSQAIESAHNAIIVSVKAIRADLERITKELDAATENAVAAAADLVADAPHRRTVATDRMARLGVDLEALQKAIDSTLKQITELEAREFDRRPDRDRLEALTQDLAEMTSELAELRSGKRMFFRELPGMSKTPWIIDLSAERILLGPFPHAGDDKLGAAVNSFAELDALLEYVRALPPSDHYFAVMIRPSGVAMHGELISALHDRGYQLGYDVLADDQVIFPEGD